MSVNTPVTIWQDNTHQTEYNNGGVYNIVDTNTDFLVDTTGIFIVDTGVIATPLPATVWEEDDSI